MSSHASRITERLQTRFRDFNFCDIVLKPGGDFMRLDTRWQVQGVYWYQASRAVTAFSRSLHIRRSFSHSKHERVRHLVDAWNLSASRGVSLSRKKRTLLWIDRCVRTWPFVRSSLSSDDGHSFGLWVDLCDLRLSRTWLLPGRDDFRI
jgi:hypothetical protein